MKAAVFLGPGKMEIQEVSNPKPKPCEVLIKVYACAVCGTDVRIFYHGQKNVVPPHIMGHEIAGTVVEFGPEAESMLSGIVKIGDKVTMVTSVGCGKCRFCEKKYYNLCDIPRYIGYYYPGGYAEYVTIPEEAVRGNNIIVAPEGLDFDEISLVEPLSCCINGQEYLNIQPEDTVVIIGAGPIGCMHAELARVRGAKQVILCDISDIRLKLAERFENLVLIDGRKVDLVEEIMKLTNGEGADVIIVACGSNRAEEQAIQMAAKKARVSFFAGLPKDNPYIKLDSNIVHYKEVSIFGAFASYRRQFEEALQLISTGKIQAKKFITHRFKLEEIIKAIETVKSGEGLKAIISI